MSDLRDRVYPWGSEARIRGARGRCSGFNTGQIPTGNST